MELHDLIDIDDSRISFRKLYSSLYRQSFFFLIFWFLAGIWMIVDIVLDGAPIVAILGTIAMFLFSSIYFLFFLCFMVVEIRINNDKLEFYRPYLLPKKSIRIKDVKSLNANCSSKFYANFFSNQRYSTFFNLRNKENIIFVIGTFPDSLLMNQAFYEFLSQTGIEIKVNKGLWGDVNLFTRK